MDYLRTAKEKRMSMEIISLLGMSVSIRQERI
jgi:hypothetical protein